MTGTDNEFDFSTMISIIQSATDRELLFINDMLAVEFRARYEKVLAMQDKICALEGERCVLAYLCPDRSVPKKQN